eukprot:TRINITY_DN13519_c0_g1_i1.p1 TRINITY_DN13519_c0_g1~~TRINITY_DN13519_c0_g1_i1.p1  ORF type:complete len:381 (+),score=30.17 TRINITY_DN13519_c0_g1_i1:135-1145(+)
MESDLDAQTRLQRLLTYKGISNMSDLLFMSQQELMERLDVDFNSCRQIQQIVYNKYCPKLQALQKDVFLPTGILALDQTMGGGICARSLTEIVGPSGVGKSQICMTLISRMMQSILLQQDRKPSDFSIWYIDTENKHSIKRLVEVLMENNPQLRTNSQLFDEVKRCIHIVQANTTSEMEDKIDTIIAGSQNNTFKNKLVVLDGVAALARIEFDKDQLYDRQELIGRIAQKLKMLAAQYEIPVVVTNQVTANISSENTSGEENIAALGLKWAHAVNTRLVVEHCGLCRLSKVAKSPVSPNMVIGFQIVGQGVIQDQRIIPYEQLDGVAEMKIRTVFG